MVEIRNKINNELVGSGEIVLENKEEIKLHTSSRIYKKKNVIVEYLMLSIVVMLMLSNCKSSKNYTNQEKENIKKVDSIIYENKLMLEMEYRENQ